MKPARNGRRLLTLGLLGICLGCGLSRAEESPSGSLARFIADPQRTPANAARDAYRHPLETLLFFGLREDQIVVEIWPGGGLWWGEFLAPFLASRGHYIAAIPPEDDASEEQRNNNRNFTNRVSADPERFGKLTVARFPASNIVPPGTADLILSFRNLHNWITAGTAEAALRSFFRALKSGGTLGIEDHRARTDLDAADQLRNGYVREDEAIRLAEQAGFKLIARSGINANPKDSKDYPAGVWTLPPTFRLREQDRARYAAIGESDRFTLRFVKP